MTTPKNKTVYLFDPDTKYFVEATNASVDPLETKKRGEPVFMIPMNSTEIKPEIKSGHWPQFIDGQWQQFKMPETVDELIEFGPTKHDSLSPFWRSMKDLRDKLITGQKYIKTELKNGFWHIEKLPEPTPEELKKQKEAEVRSQRDYEISKTDYLLNADYPISDEARVAVVEYRQLLRDIPQQPGFPYEVVWPTMPNIKAIEQAENNNSVDEEVVND